MLLKMFAAVAATVAMGGVAAAQPLPPADGLPPLNSGIPKAVYPSMQGVASTGTATDTAASVGGAEGTGGDTVKQALGREIDKMGKSGAHKTTQPLGALDLGSDAGRLVPGLMRPGSGLTTYSGQSSNWIPK